MQIPAGHRLGWRRRDRATPGPESGGGLVVCDQRVRFTVNVPNDQGVNSVDVTTLLHRNSDAAVTFVAFDVLYADAAAATSLPFAERRGLLESLPLNSPAYVGPTFDDGRALFDAVCRDGLEGIVANVSATRTSRASGPG